MEAEGVAQAAKYPGIQGFRGFFVIKGISDLADEQSKGSRRSEQEVEEHDRWQEYAASASVEAFVQFLTYCKDRSLIVPTGTANEAQWQGSHPDH
jgi:nucleoside phosphorylase